MDFKEYINQNHPDPDSLLYQNFEQMCVLAEMYAIFKVMNMLIAEKEEDIKFGQ